MCKLEVTYLIGSATSQTDPLPNALDKIHAN